MAFPLPLGDTYWYRNNDEKPARAGTRAEAPFGNRSLVGFVVETAEACPIDPVLVKTIRRAIDTEAVFSAATVSLAEWVASMYFCSVGEALGAMLPTGRREIAQISAESRISRMRKALPLTARTERALEGILKMPAGTTSFRPDGTADGSVLQAPSEPSRDRSVIYLVPKSRLRAKSSGRPAAVWGCLRRHPFQTHAFPETIGMAANPQRGSAHDNWRPQRDLRPRPKPRPHRHR